jgi:hypothetical protein
VPIATFRVSNKGSKSAHIMFDQVASSETPLSQEMPAAMAVYGECEVRPGTNCIVSIRGPVGSDYWRVHASVFEAASLGSKLRFAAGRLRLTLSGQPGFRPFWVRNFHERPYRLLSPEVPGARRLMLKSGAASWPAEHGVWTGTNSFRGSPVSAQPAL